MITFLWRSFRRYFYFRQQRLFFFFLSKNYVWFFGFNFSLFSFGLHFLLLFSFFIDFFFKQELYRLLVIAVFKNIISDFDRVLIYIVESKSSILVRVVVPKKWIFICLESFLQKADREPHQDFFASVLMHEILVESTIKNHAEIILVLSFLRFCRSL